ncbi:DUF4242 domain-containing protein [Methyloceanibacter superfactus]|uniref:DUF4242 domain-containing protein n=1 Tax=Methyloceanibacter superfactus TaxID=1774969 RepID=UPI00114D02BE|nr:DUF4242 domain-containing protein [Methyloceanibacter superfactus]
MRLRTLDQSAARRSCVVLAKRRDRSWVRIHAAEARFRIGCVSTAVWAEACA